MRIFGPKPTIDLNHLVPSAHSLKSLRLFVADDLGWNGKEQRGLRGFQEVTVHPNGEGNEWSVGLQRRALGESRTDDHLRVSQTQVPDASHAMKLLSLCLTHEVLAQLDMLSAQSRSKSKIQQSFAHFSWLDRPLLADGSPSASQEALMQDLKKNVLIEFTLQDGRVLQYKVPAKHSQTLRGLPKEYGPEIGRREINPTKPPEDPFNRPDDFQGTTKQGTALDEWTAYFDTGTARSEPKHYAGMSSKPLWASEQPVEEPIIPEINLRDAHIKLDFEATPKRFEQFEAKLREAFTNRPVPNVSGKTSPYVLSVPTHFADSWKPFGLRQLSRNHETQRTLLMGRLASP